MENDELSYKEHCIGKIKTIMDNYVKNIKSYTRNIDLDIGDMENGFLTEDFLNSTKLNNFIMDKLTLLTTEAKKEIEQYTIT